MASSIDMFCGTVTLSNAGRIPTGFYIFTLDNPSGTETISVQFTNTNAIVSSANSGDLSGRVGFLGSTEGQVELKPSPLNQNQYTIQASGGIQYVWFNLSSAQNTEGATIELTSIS